MTLWLMFFPIGMTAKRTKSTHFKGGLTITVVFDEGLTKCGPTDPQTESSSWAFLENETKLLAQGFTFFIERLDEDNLIISASQTSGGSTYTLKITFKH